MGKKKVETLTADLLKYVDRIENSVDEQVAQSVGYTVRYRMLELISKGISPILGYGRFPEYKGATRDKVARRGQKFLRKEIKNISKQLKLGRVSTGSSSAVGRLKAKKDRLRTLKAIASGKQKKGYPYNTKEFKEGKKFPRPVNLFLTGAFLQALTFAFKRTENQKMIVEIGWFGDPENAIKEKGHREGANGQPKRPTLPRGNERWNQTIQLDIIKLLRDAVTKAAKSAKK